MPKLKTHKSFAKRIKFTGSGKLKRRSAFISHNLGKKSAAQKRRHKGNIDVAQANRKKIKQLVPYQE